MAVPDERSFENQIAASRRPDARPLPPDVLARIRGTRRYPKLSQSDYLHLRILGRDLAAVFRSFDRSVRDVLDVYCGTRPYDDLLPHGAHCTGLDINNFYGAADVISNEFLPFADESFDLVMCLEAFHYVEDPTHGVSEIRRVLRPGGTALIAVPLVWEYDRTILEHRYTGPELCALFDGWDELDLVENGGRAVSWTTLTGHIVDLVEQRLARRSRVLGRILQPVFAGSYVVINLAGMLIDLGEQRWSQHSPFTLPMNLLLTARRPRT